MSTTDIYEAIQGIEFDVRLKKKIMAILGFNKLCSFKFRKNISNNYLRHLINLNFKVENWLIFIFMNL